MMKGKKNRSFRLWLVVAGVGVGLFSLVEFSGRASGKNGNATVRVVAATAEEQGEYLVRIAGCNHCHTPGYSESGGKVPKEKWLTGEAVGCRGPWGTTYASNLRLYVDPMSEDDWVKIIRARHDKPPMPWDSLHAMSDSDLRAIHRFIKSLGKAGEKTPQDLPPGEEPKTPYLVFAPPTMRGK